MELEALIRALAPSDVIGQARHPELKWPDIRDVAPTLKALYDAEPDGLFWFAGAQPYPGVASVVDALPQAASEQGLEDFFLELTHDAGEPARGRRRAGLARLLPGGRR